MSNSRFSTYISSAIIVVAVLFLGSCAEKFELSLTGLSGGSVIMSPADGAYSEGTRVTLTATPNSGYAFTGWGNIGEYSSNYSIEKEIEILMPAKSIQLSTSFSTPNKGWTFMIYMAGDNSLSDVVNLDLNEIEKGLFDSVSGGNSAIANDVRVLVLADFLGSSNTRLYQIIPDDTNYLVSPVLSTEFNPTGELNMADPQTLQNFVNYGLTNYPSEHNALVLWNHGGGVKSLDIDPFLNKGICEDDGEILYLNEVQTAVEAALGSGNKLDILGMDACLMGEVETAYEMRTVADYFVASAANELGYGWGYNYIFNNFTSAGNPPSPETLADILVTQFQQSTPSILHYDPDTMVAVKTSELEVLKTAIDALAAQVYTDGAGAQAAFQTARDASVYYHVYDDPTEIRYIPYYDIYSFCTEIEASSLSPAVRTQAGVVKTALASSVVASYGNSSKFDTYHSSWPPLNLNYDETTDSAAVRGLSISIPHGEKVYESKSYYYTLWWYGDQLYNTNVTGVVLGGIDFCTYDSDGTVETWRELFEAWYDGDGDTPGTY